MMPVGVFPSESDPDSATPSAPPTRPGPIVAPARPSTWPTVIGIIAIILGAGGILWGLWSALGPLLARWFEPFMLEGQVEAMDEWMPWTSAASLLAAVTAIMLLAGGMKVIKRKTSAPRILCVWAVVRIIGGLFTAIVGTMAQRAHIEAIQSEFDTTPMPLGPAFFDVMLFVGIAVGLVWAWAPPVFMLIWFARKKIKDEVAGWS